MLNGCSLTILILGVLSSLSMVCLQIYTLAVDYPMNIFSDSSIQMNWSGTLSAIETGVGTAVLLLCTVTAIPYLDVLNIKNRTPIKFATIYYAIMALASIIISMYRLSETGIIPSYLMGIDIKKIRSELTDFFTKEKLFLKESSIYLSNILLSNKLNNLIFLNYAPEFEKFLFWCQQLIAESLGKKGKGFLPIISNVPKDHHSLLQLYLDGPKDKIFYIFSTKSKSKRKVNLKNYIDNKNSLDKKSLQTIKDAQKDALIKSLIKIKAPFREFIIKNINEETLGTIFSYFITETIITGRICKINPFNQPAVEQVKKYTKLLLN